MHHGNDSGKILFPHDIEMRERQPPTEPETLASTIAVRKHLGRAPRIFFPDPSVLAETGNLEHAPVPFS
jgi:hypothetical protein